VFKVINSILFAERQCS